MPSWIARAVIYPEIFARTMAAILDCPEIFAGRMAAILDIQTNPLPMPHIPADRNHKNARIPHLLGTQRAANKGINPHQSPTYPGVGGVGIYFDWCIRCHKAHFIIKTQGEVNLTPLTIVKKQPGNL